MKRILLTLVIVPAVVLLWLIADGTRPYLRGNKPVLVDIPRGVRTMQIAEQLEDAGAIRSRWTFLALHLFRRGNTLKAGEYEFDKPASAFFVLGKLIRGDVSYETLVVPEGFNRFEIATAVAAQGFSTREEFLRATEDAQPIADLDPEATDLEGYLFPDSYKLPRHARPAEIVRAMVQRFREVNAQIHPTNLDRPLREIVIVASLVEKETALASERPVIAGIFYNRLQKEIPLQADPSVAYAAVVANRYMGKIRKTDLNFDSPYNTYMHRGLPAGPIANPGEAALRAAITPASTEYLYFVANLDGGHTFSKTLAEHNLAVAQYRENLAALLKERSQESAAMATQIPAQETR